jgi:hypothetical protein
MYIIPAGGLVGSMLLKHAHQAELVMRGTRKKPGRRPLPDGLVRSQFFGLRLSCQERQALESAASSTGVSISQFLREAALRDADRVEELATRLP